MAQRKLSDRHIRTRGPDNDGRERGSYALVQLHDGRTKEVADLVRTLPDVRTVDAIQGPYQLIARLAGDDAGSLRAIDGVSRVVTIVPQDPSRKVRSVASPSAGTRPARRGFAIPNPCGSSA